MILLQFYDIFFVKLKNELNDTFFFNIFMLNKLFSYRYTNITAYYYITYYHKIRIILHKKNVNQKIKFKERERMGEACEDDRMDSCIRGRTYSRKFAGVISNQIY